jgi:hypothetical protein
MGCSHEALDWATLVKVDYALRDSPSVILPPHPAVAVANVVHAILRPHWPHELYSDERPAYLPPSGEDDLIPVDVLLGCYSSAERTIKIFIRNIEYYAHAVFHTAPDDLARIVRLHEYGHALVHLGLFYAADTSRITMYPVGTATHWASFEAERDNLFLALDERTHEYLAQLMTWLALCTPAEGPSGKPLRDLFVQLMQRQRPVYRIDQEVLDSVTVDSCIPVLRWIWDPARPGPPVGIPLVEAVTALSLPVPNGTT